MAHRIILPIRCPARELDHGDIHACPRNFHARFRLPAAVNPFGIPPGVIGKGKLRVERITGIGAEVDPRVGGKLIHARIEPVRRAAVVGIAGGTAALDAIGAIGRSEERRVGKECA